MEQTKRCGTCGKEKPLSEFHSSSDAHDKHQGRCKSCVSENNKLLTAQRKRARDEWREAHPRERR